MSSLGRMNQDQAWKDARKICRLNSRQVEMARALGMNPKKLPKLRPNPQQHWKLPVGAFIEECYQKRFGRDPPDQQSHQPEPRTHKFLTPKPNVKDSAAVESQVSSLVCYFLNIADDLEAWLANGTIDPEVLPQLSRELREIAEALESGAPVFEMPEIPQSPGPARHISARRQGREWEFDDDDIPF